MPTQDLERCPRCGAAVDRDASTCPVCATILVPPPTGAFPHEKPDWVTSPHPVVLGAGIVGIFLATFALVPFLYGDRIGSRSPGPGTSGSGPRPAYSASVQGFRLVPGRTAEGAEAQRLLVDWRNDGAEPIGTVHADIDAIDASGAQTYHASDVRIFRAESEMRCIAPGSTFTPPEGEGFWLAPLSAGEVRRVAVTNTRAERYRP